MDTGSTGIGISRGAGVIMLADATKICLPFSDNTDRENLFTGTESDKKINHLEFENGVSRGKSGKFYVLQNLCRSPNVMNKREKSFIYITKSLSRNAGYGFFVGGDAGWRHGVWGFCGDAW